LELQIESQDRLTNWCEYLARHYVLYERETERMVRDQPKYDNDYEELKEFLRPTESLGNVMNSFNFFGYGYDVQLAKEALQRSKSALERAEADYTASPHSNYLKLRLEDQKVSVETLQNNLEFRKRKLETISAFNRFASGFLTAKESYERHPVLLKWMREQIPQLQLERDSKKRKLEDIEMPEKVKRTRKKKNYHRLEGPRRSVRTVARPLSYK